MNPTAHEAARCREGLLCAGVGCRVNTGKTRRKKNHARPKPNKHESTRLSVTTGGKKR